MDIKTRGNIGRWKMFSHLNLVGHKSCYILEKNSLPVRVLNQRGRLKEHRTHDFEREIDKTSRDPNEHEDTEVNGDSSIPAGITKQFSEFP